MSLIDKLKLITQLYLFNLAHEHVQKLWIWLILQAHNCRHCYGTLALEFHIFFDVWSYFFVGAILVKVISWNKNVVTFLEVGWHYLGLVKAWKFIYVWTEEFDRRSIDNVRLFSFDLLIAVIIRWYFDIYSCINFLSIHVWNQQYFHLSINCAHYLFFPIIMRFFRNAFLKLLPK